MVLQPSRALVLRGSQLNVEEELGCRYAAISLDI